ncbi:MAG: hypothetical protein JWN15_2388 [Firmicutes bacterium]|nr:hypothetical protein [Bacillota bacterium]
MAQHEDAQLNIGSGLGAWPELVPDPEAIDQVLALMLAGVAAPAAVAATAMAAAEPGESQFRLLSYIWAAAALSTYLAWDLLAGWLQPHPAGIALLITFACVSLLAPLLLLPIVRTSEAPVTDEGGSIPC